MNEYAPATIKRMVKTICENPGVTVGQLAMACNLDHDRCLQTLKDYGQTLGLEMDPRSKRFYPAGVRGIRKNTKAGKAAFDESCRNCLKALPERLGKIAEKLAEAKRREQAYIKEKARQVAARKAAWEQEQALKSQRAEQLRIELEKERRDREREAIKRQQLQSIKVMDVDTLSAKITAADFAAEPDEIQLAMTNQLLERLEAQPDAPVKKSIQWTDGKLLGLAALVGGGLGFLWIFGPWSNVWKPSVYEHPCAREIPADWCAEAYPEGYR